MDVMPHRVVATKRNVKRSPDQEETALNVNSEQAGKINVLLQPNMCFNKSFINLALLVTNHHAHKSSAHRWTWTQTGRDASSQLSQSVAAIQPTEQRARPQQWTVHTQAISVAFCGQYFCDNIYYYEGNILNSIVCLKGDDWWFLNDTLNSSFSVLYAFGCDKLYSWTSVCMYYISEEDVRLKSQLNFR